MKYPTWSFWYWREKAWEELAKAKDREILNYIRNLGRNK